MFRILLSVCFGFVTMSTFAQLASEPTAQPTNLRKDSYDKPWTFDIRFDAVASANGYLVLRATEPITFTPLDGVAYTKGEGVGNAKVFSTSASSAIRIKEVGAGVDYHFAIFAYNINGTNEASINYLQASPLTGTLRSQDNNPGGYYSAINFSSPTVITDLKNLINPHTMVAYGDFTSTIVREFHERDTVGGQRVVNCQYSNEYLLYTGNFGLGTYNYSREHRMPFSWINFSGITRGDFEGTPEGCDIHALELNNNDVNFRRSNHPYSSNVVTPLWTYLEFTQGTDSRNKSVASITEMRRGDAARAKLYMMLCYNGKYGRNWGLDGLLSDSDNQDVQQLLNWHFNDLPDAFEKARHEYVVSKQGNRNPFIDFPDLANCIDFTDMTLIGNCAQYVGITQLAQQTDFMLYPQPTADVVNISFNAPATHMATLTVYDLTGKLVSQEAHQLVAGSQNIQYNAASLVPGYYLFAIEGGEMSARGRFMVAK